MKKLTSALALAALALSATVSAESAESNVNYHTMGVGYTSQDVDGLDNISGFNVHSNTYIFGSNFLFKVDYVDLEGDFDGTTVGLTETEVQVGYAFEISPDWAIDVNAGYLASSAKLGGMTANEPAITYAIGTKYMVAENVELFGNYKNISYQDVDISDSEVEVGGKYILGNWGLSASYTTMDEASQYAIGLEYRL